MRTFLLLMLVSVVGLGCAQMRYSGRYQEVKIESEPPGAKVLVEGRIGPLSPVGVKAPDGTELAYCSPMQLTTPVVVILDKDNREYRVRVACEGYPEYEKTLRTRFAFHPYLIITFPVVPFWSDYEIKRYDDIFVDFEACKAELEAKMFSDSEKVFEDALSTHGGKLKKLEEITAELKNRQKELTEAEKKVSELEEEVEKARETLEAADEEEAQKAKEKLDKAKEELEKVQAAFEKLGETVEEMVKRLPEAQTGEAAAKRILDEAKKQYEDLKKKREEEQKKREQEQEKEKESEKELEEKLKKAQELIEK